MSGELCLAPVEGNSCMKPVGHDGPHDSKAWPWPSEPQAPPPWWADHAKLALTAQFMVRQGHSVEDVLYLLEKPGKHNDDYNLAEAELSLGRDES
jgi:hypothetical protein